MHVIKKYQIELPLLNLEFKHASKHLLNLEL